MDKNKRAGRKSKRANFGDRLKDIKIQRRIRSDASYARAFVGLSLFVWNGSGRYLRFGRGFTGRIGRG